MTSQKQLIGVLHAIMDRNKTINLDLPIAETVYRVIFDAENAIEIGLKLLTRTPKRENTL